MGRVQGVQQNMLRRAEGIAYPPAATGAHWCCKRPAVPFVKPCKRQPEPAWTECLLDAIEYSYPHFMKGNERYGLPPMDPFHMDKLLIEQGTQVFGFAIENTNVTITGIGHGRVTSAKVEFEEETAKYNVAVPELNMVGNYFLSGKILTLYVNGSGDEVIKMNDVNMLGENTQTIRENTEILLKASKAIGLEVNPEKTKYMIMSRDQNIVRNGNIKIGDLSFEEVEKFKYLGATVTNINDTREEIKRRINMGNACYYSVEKLLSSSLLSKNLKVRIYKTVILPVLLYGCETWTLTLREEHRLKVFENKVLRKIFGAKRDEVTGEWRKLHNTELHTLYSSPNIIRNIKSRRLRWAGHVARMGESRNAYRVLVGRPEVKRPLGRPRRRWEDNIKMDLREVGCDDRDWINLAQDRDRWRAYVRAAMNLRVQLSRLRRLPDDLELRLGVDSISARAVYLVGFFRDCHSSVITTVTCQPDSYGVGFVTDNVRADIAAKFKTYKAQSKRGVEHEYINVTELKMDLDFDSVEMQFDNLFNGNKLLGVREEAVSRKCVYDWFKRFREGKETIEDEPRSGRPSTSRTPEMIEKVRQMLAQDRRLTLRLIAEELDISKDTVHTIVRDDLGSIASENHRHGDETWCYHFDPESKRQSMSWCSPTSPRPKKKSRLQKSKVKTLLIAVFDNNGIIHKEFVPAGQTINAAFYQSVLNLLLQRIRRVRPELHKTGKWMLLHYNVPAHCAIRVRQFLAHKMVTVLEHPPYSSDLAAFKRETGKSPQEPDQGSTEDDQEQASSSEPGIGKFR
ncbi:hypothetical protein ANN_10258 [Periplaneta americana]|uniref:Uncharacterized protein n=1 Tax=Periplaneta americana TaxID=6978 RepID=A0ABQ8TNX5_PERAM|nr:hypothetical protein ANN_10258 [Periplaneta americana]